MRMIAVLLTLLGFFAATNAGAADDIEYRLVDGAIVVFGHTLTPAEPLPDNIKCEECGAFHSVSLVQSPDKRWVLIISDVRLQNFDAWVFDTQSKSAPRRITDTRRGRHFTGVEWHSDDRLELSFGGMGYTTSLLFDAARAGGPKVIDNLLLYDGNRDVYVRYLYDSETSTDRVEVGRVFSVDEAIERFDIALDNKYVSNSRFMIQSVQIDGANLLVTYDTTARGKVRDVFEPRALDRIQ